MIEFVRDNIERGVYPLDKRLPSERKMAEEFGVSKSQVRKALQTLVKEGYLDCLRGNGYFVRKNCRKSGRRHQVALCIEAATSNILATGKNFYTGMLLNQAVVYDLNLQVFTLPREPQMQNELFFNLISQDIDGIICFPYEISEMLPAMLEIKKRNIPFVFWEYSPFHGQFPYVGVDHFQSCFNAAEVLSKCQKPVRYIGFEDKEQNEQKYAGFRAGCDAFVVTAGDPVLVPHSMRFSSQAIYDQLQSLRAGELYYTATRMLTRVVIGYMMDRGLMPGRDYFLLGTDQLNIIDGSSIQLDCMMRDNNSIMHTLLSMMSEMITQVRNYSCDYRIEMKYISGMSLKLN